MYTHHALGLSGLLIDKLRKVIPGSKTIMNGSVTKWQSLKNAQSDISSDVISRQAFGPEGLVQFRSLVEKLESEQE